MDRTEILEKIKQAEIKVEEAIRAAEEERKNKILEAKMKAREIIESAEAEAAKVKEDILNSARQQIEAEKEEIRKSETKKIEDYAKKGKDNIMKAVEMLYNEFVGMMGHA
ncbi:ATP synthase archaeal subunit H [Archaeoglobus sp.]|uniref:ATP synthase archaeal subunit H n=1 Tax=Archaeoglobus sp. TaxID=1872626 RepID=UPI0025B8828C|nr:ATP synthase archaeal subunit H [Archaeoglobus sp.]